MTTPTDTAAGPPTPADTTTAPTTSPTTATTPVSSANSATPTTAPDTLSPRGSEPVVIGAESAPIGLSEATHAWAARMRRHWAPPDLWENGRPDLRTSWLWARYGHHLPDDEQARRPGRITTAIRLPFRALFLYLDWIFDRDSRLVAALVLAFTVIQTLHPLF